MPTPCWRSRYDTLLLQAPSACRDRSPRHFSRVFRVQTGMAPAKAIEKLRVEAAQELIDQGHSSISRIAAMTGFGDEERLRRARNDHVYMA